MESQLQVESTIPTRQSNTEVWIGLVSALALGAFYIPLELFANPTPSGSLEHMVGIVGTALMLFTEFAYMARKRIRWLKVGRLRVWLSIHIVTGIVGPAMVIFHSTFKYHGLALLATVLTLLVVLSGFVGRYLYTAIPRNVAGAELTREEITEQAAQARARLQRFLIDKPKHMEHISRQITTSGSYDDTMWGVVLRQWEDWQDRWRTRAALRRLDRDQKALARQLIDLQRQVDRVERQLARLDTARKLLGLWHLVHLPLGLTLFSSAFIHVVAVYYYGAAVIP